MTQVKAGDIVRKANGGTWFDGKLEQVVDYTEDGWVYPVGYDPSVHANAPGKLLIDDVVVVGHSTAQSKTDQDFKADAGKLDWTLLMGGNGLIRTLEGVVRVLDFAVRPKDQGGKGYERHSWRQVPRAKERYRAALHRHLAAIERGELTDPESGESHWYHVCCCSLFLAELENQDDG